jgi:hypothetical protein
MGAHLHSGMLEMGLLLGVSSVDRNRSWRIVRMDFDNCRVKLGRQSQQATGEPQDEALDESMWTPVHEGCGAHLHTRSNNAHVA